MLADALPDDAGNPPAPPTYPRAGHRPGDCGDHPGFELVKQDRLPFRRRSYYWHSTAVFCPSDEHAGDLEAMRCAWCGGPLWSADDRRRGYVRSSSALTCSDRCRLQRNRAERRARGVKIGGRVPRLGDRLELDGKRYRIVGTQTELGGPAGPMPAAVVLEASARRAPIPTERIRFDRRRDLWTVRTPGSSESEAGQ